MSELKMSANTRNSSISQAKNRKKMSIDQASAEKHPSILRTLAGYRRHDGKVFFGQNGLHSTNGRISVGDPVTIR